MPAQLHNWHLNRKECLAGRPLWPDCPTCADRTDLDTYCRFCDGTVERLYYASGGIHGWRRYERASLATLDWRWLGPALTEGIQCYADLLPAHIENGAGALLVGGVGCGKTHISVGLGLVALAHGYSVYATTFGELLLAIRASFDEAARQSEAALMQAICSVDLLILDDLGMEKPSPWAVDRLAYVINSRYSANRATLVTSNYAPERLAHMWGERVMSSLYSTSQTISLAGVRDYRMHHRLALLETVRRSATWPGTEAEIVVSEDGADK